MPPAAASSSVRAPPLRFRLAAGGELTYDEYLPAAAARADGDGLAFVLVPGMGDTRAQYRALAPALLAAVPGAARAVAVDLRGCGESDPAPFRGAFGVDDTARDVCELARGLGLRRVVLVGSSMAAASVAAAAADLAAAAGGAGDGPGPAVAGVVWLGPFAWDHAMPCGVPALLSVMLWQCWGAGMWAGYLRSLYKDHAPADVDAHVAGVRASLAAPGRLAVLRAHVFAPKAACAARIPELARRGTPVLGVWGGKDPDFADVEAEAREARARVRHAETLTLPGVGHYPAAERPQHVADAVAAWLARAAEGGGAAAARE